MAQRSTPVRRTGRPRSRAQPLGITAADQTLEVLKEIAGSGRPSSLTELCAATRMQPSKLHRYLVSLCASGMVTRNKDASLYSLGPAALSLGALSLAQLDELGVLRELMSALGDRLREVLFLYVWSRAGPVLILSQVPPESRLRIRLGTIAPLYESATGLVFVAHLPRWVTLPLLTSELQQMGENPDATVARLDESVIPSIIADQVYWSDVTLIPNSCACAAPVFDSSGEILAVVGTSLSTLGQSDVRERVTSLIRDAAAEASRALGFHPLVKRLPRRPDREAGQSGR